MKKLILLDAYALIFRAYYAMIRMPRITSRGMNTSAIYGFVNTLDEVLRKQQPDYIGVAFDPKGGTFRHERYPQYKAQREATPEDIHLAVPYIKRILEGYRIPVLEVAGYEADDVIGTLATKASRLDDMLTLMMTPDKDYGQLVKANVKMLRPRHASSELEVMGVDEVCAKYGIQSPLQVIDLLGLMGDASDNVPGCPGIDIPISFFVQVSSQTLQAARIRSIHDLNRAKCRPIHQVPLWREKETRILLRRSDFPTRRTRIESPYRRIIAPPFARGIQAETAMRLVSQIFQH